MIILTRGKGSAKSLGGGKEEGERSSLGAFLALGQKKRRFNAFRGNGRDNEALSVGILGMEYLSGRGV